MGKFPILLYNCRISSERGDISMKINNNEYGGFIVSNNILNGIAVKYLYREQSSKKELNGWTLYSELDTDEYVSDPNNFSIISATTIYNIVPVVLEIFNAPYGTDICLLYERGVHVGFYDLKKDGETTILEILNGE